MANRLLLRADASTAMGTGHVMRCLALAQAWQRYGGQAHFLQTERFPGLEARLLAAGCTVQYLTEITSGSLADANATTVAAQGQEAKWVVVDGYHFDAAYQQQLKQAGLKLLWMDDFGHCEAYNVDLVLNQNVYAHEGLYLQRSADTQLLLGCDYALLRSEFKSWIGWQRQIKPTVQRLLVTLGGADPENQTLKVLRALALIQMPLTVTVLVGAANPHREMLEEVAAQLREQHEIILLQNVSNMPELIANADLAICAGGSTTWEMAFLGLPTIILEIAGNQRMIAQELDNRGVSINLGWFEEVHIDKVAFTLCDVVFDSDKRLQMSRRGQALVDGLGAERIVKVMQR